LTEKHRIVVSAENTAYMAWQCKLFYFSCVTRLGNQPIFIVHANGDSWASGFSDLARAGAFVRQAPSYLCEKRLITRNTVGTLIHAASLLESDQFLVLCDPDMVFAREIELPSQLGGNFYHYLQYDQPHIVSAAERFGLARDTLLRKQEQICCGVPYVIPAVHAARLGKTWLEAMDCFRLDERAWDSIWLDVMYAFGLAVTKLGWNVARFDLVDMDEGPDMPLQHSFVHYCLGDAGWDKRWFRSEEKADEVWDSTFEAPDGTVAQELFAQIREAREFYRGSSLDMPRAKICGRT